MLLDQDGQAEEVIEFPGGLLPLNSRFYVERPPLETQICQEIQRPGSVIRIQAPRKMGKSSLLLRLLAHAQSLGYRTINFDFQAVDAQVFSSLDRLLRWFSANASRQLRLPSKLADYWDETIGSKVNCTLYFEEYLLSETAVPIVLAFNEVNLLFEYPDLAKEFLALLRYWYERAKQMAEFQKMRLVVVHSTEIYVPLQIHQSPFNVGLPVKLPEFNLAQVQELAQRYRLGWTTEAEGKNQLAALLAMVGGSPYRLGLAFYHLYRGESLEQILQTAPTATGVYSVHLQDLLLTLAAAPDLKAALWQVITAEAGVELNSIVAYKLSSLGLVKLNGNRAMPSCELYRLYFRSQLLEEREQAERLQILEVENRRLKHLVDNDTLTHLANRRYFDRALALSWRQALPTATPLSLILLDVDDFKAYNDTYGHPAGDSCLRQVAYAIGSCLRPTVDLAARYGGEEFVVILPQKSAPEAVALAEAIRSAIKQLNLPHINSRVNTGVVTASFGVASFVPYSDNDGSILLLAADEALYRAKQQGRDCVVLNQSLGRTNQ